MNSMAIGSSYRSTELEIAATLIRVSNSVRVRLDNALSRENITWAGYEVLDMLCVEGSMTYRMLSIRLDRHRTSVTSIVAGLVSSGLATRSVGSVRRDEFVVDATPSGFRVRERASRALTKAKPSILPAECSVQLLDQLRELERARRGD